MGIGIRPSKGVRQTLTLVGTHGAPLFMRSDNGPEFVSVIDSWRQHCNEVRPHSSLQYLTPTEFKQQLRQDPQPDVF